MFKLMASIVLALSGAIPNVTASHLDNIDGIFDSYSFDEVKFKTRTNCSLDKYPEVSRQSRKPIFHAKIWHECPLLSQIRTWLDTDAAQFTKTPILVTSDGMSRLELFKNGELIDTVHVHRYHREELS